MRHDEEAEKVMAGFRQELRRRRFLQALPLVGIVIALWFALAPGTPAAPAFVRAPVAYGCGLGQSPTMLANSIAAMLYPGSQTSSSTAPILGMFGPTFVANQAITFDEDLSQVPNAPPKSQIPLQWNFGDGSTANGFGIKHTYTKSGTYDIFTYIPGDPEPFDSAKITVLAAAFPNPPVAVIHASATAVAAGDKVTFDATGSHAVVGSQLSYSWNFADGDTATGAHVTHVFSGAKLGKSFVSLIVTDSRGAVTVATSPIVVVQQLPKAQLSASSTTLATGETVTFDASGSSAPSVPPNDQLTSYTWNFGDGTPSVKTSSPTTTHSYRKPGHYTATVQAYDQQDAYGTATVNVTVEAFSVDSAGPPWPIFGGGLAAVVLLIGGWFFLRAQQRRAAMVRQALARQELARARQVNGAPRRQQAIPAHRRPPQNAAGPYPPRRGGPPTGTSGPYPPRRVPPEYGGPPHGEPSGPYGPGAPRGRPGGAPPARGTWRDEDDWS
jgi:plastocyanin